MTGGRGVSEFLRWLEQAVFEAETGRATSQEISHRLINEWGGIPVKVPRIHPDERDRIRELIDLGTAERTARRFVRGK
jgi:hypothetical protein